MMKNKLLVMGLAAVFVMAGTASAQNLLSNGDFELSSPILDTNGVATGFYESEFWDTATTGTAWAEIANKTELQGNTYGTLHANIGSGWYEGTSEMWQTVSGVSAGDWYKLSVDSGADAWWLPTGQMSLIWLDGSDVVIGSASMNTVDPAVYGENYDIPHPMQKYSLYSQAPVGAVSVQVEFASAMDPGVGGSITFDNAYLEIVPEPATLGLLGLSGLALWFVRRRV
jgi:hypothetical protein